MSSGRVGVVTDEEYENAKENQRAKVLLVLRCLNRIEPDPEAPWKGSVTVAVVQGLGLLQLPTLLNWLLDDLHQRKDLLVQQITSLDALSGDDLNSKTIEELVEQEAKLFSASRQPLEAVA